MRNNTDRPVIKAILWAPASHVLVLLFPNKDDEEKNQKNQNQWLFDITTGHTSYFTDIYILHMD